MFRVRIPGAVRGRGHSLSQAVRYGCEIASGGMRGLASRKANPAGPGTRC